MRAAIHYITAAILLTIYGGQVCPFIETLPFMVLGMVVSSWLLFFFMIRISFTGIVVENSSLLDQPRQEFLLEITVFGAAGLAMAFFNMAMYDFPFGSGLKLFVGCLTLGFFTAVDLALARDYQIAGRIGREMVTAAVPRFFSLTRKMALVSMVLAVVTSIVLVLVILHDLNWVITLPADTNLYNASKGIVGEFVFVLAVMIAYTSNLIVSYTRNLKLYFGRQTATLKEVAGGKLEGHVPVTTNDEFGVIASYTNRMIAALRERTEQLQLTQDVTILSLASLAETRDNETGQHIIRTQHYVRALAEDLKEFPDFSDILDEACIDLLFKSAPLHDIGKVGIPDLILLKPGRLTPDEFEIMKGHTTLGHDALLLAVKQLGESSFLHLAREIAYSHHEKWDGSGYPEGLQGKAIPLSGRLMALADVYDALITKRVYKEAFRHEKAVEIITDGRGVHVDPQVVDAFFRVENTFKDIAQQHKDRVA
jgi:response regulator RpfG family c-di-GMP phosphodiesterase